MSSLVESTSSDDYRVSSFAASNSSDGKLHIILTNKNIHSTTSVKIDLGSKKWTSAHKYFLDKNGSKIKKDDNPIKIKGNEFI